ncbi:MAG: bifunctional 3,4-dihydroxy-2-butanone-4-phosphate synthase/GTP cyclohydrolase II [Gemmatimonadetes bacterium]|nr:bifunctional 3,4-dihydroxy-2-butanone-4-phosphate synthase/GTP cyclohydrolase II [Gemmatimonadota bacterium]
MPFDSAEEAIEAIRRGEMVIVADDEDRENEGDLVGAAEKVTPDIINFMATHARGLICVTLTPQRVEELKLQRMAGVSTESHEADFMTSIDAGTRFGVTTGISAWDRATTIRVAIDPKTRPEDLRRPGHVFPLRAQPGGVLRRVGQTEASVDLAKLAGLCPAGVICEILNPDGSMARRPELERFAEKHGLKFITVAQLIAYRLQTERLVHRVAEAGLPTALGEFRVVAYENDVDSREHIALVKGQVAGEHAVLVRVHSECVTGDVFHSQRCDCGEQLVTALGRIDEAGQGVLVYLQQEGRGIGLINKIRAYELQDKGFDTVEANVRLGFPPDLRDYGIGVQILLDLGIKSMRILTNNPKKIVGLEGFGIRVDEQIPLSVEPNPHNRDYLEVKREKLGHLIPGDARAPRAASG